MVVTGFALVPVRLHARTHAYLSLSANRAKVFNLVESHLSFTLSRLSCGPLMYLKFHPFDVRSAYAAFSRGFEACLPSISAYESEVSRPTIAGGKAQT